MKYRRFEEDPTLLAIPYHVRCPVHIATFRAFVDALNGTHPEITTENVYDLGLLCMEFDFAQLSDQISSYRSQDSSIDFDARAELALLREAVTELQRAIELLHRDTDRQSVASLREDVDSLREENHHLLESNEGLGLRRGWRVSMHNYRQSPACQPTIVLPGSISISIISSIDICFR
jgi:hypothetical protein